jgi:hypothetical protein
MGIRVAIAVAGLAAGGIACGDSADDGVERGESAPSEDETGSTTTTATNEVPREIGVEVLDLGAEPHQELRLHFEEGASHDVTLHHTQEQRISSDGQEQTATSGTEIDVSYLVESIDDGVATITVTYDDARLLEADPAARTTLEDILGAFVGLEGTMRIDERGQIVDADVPLPDLEGDLAAIAEPFLEGFSDQIENLATPFPIEAVGVGAVWEIESVATLAGVGTTTTSTFTLRSVAGGVIEADASIVLELSGAPSGVDIISSDFLGNGTFRWTAGALVAEFDQVVEGTTIFELSDGQQLEQFQHQELSTTRR